MIFPDSVPISANPQESRECTAIQELEGAKHELSICLGFTGFTSFVMEKLPHRRPCSREEFKETLDAAIRERGQKPWDRELDVKADLFFECLDKVAKLMFQVGDSLHEACRYMILLGKGDSVQEYIRKNGIKYPGSRSFSLDLFLYALQDGSDDVARAAVKEMVTYNRMTIPWLYIYDEENFLTRKDTVIKAAFERYSERYNLGRYTNGTNTSLELMNAAGELKRENYDFSYRGP